MGIKNDLQKKKRILYIRKKHLKKYNKNTKVKKLIFFYIEIWIFLLITYTMIIEPNH